MTSQPAGRFLRALLFCVLSTLVGFAYENYQVTQTIIPPSPGPETSMFAGGDGYVYYGRSYSVQKAQDLTAVTLCGSLTESGEIDGTGTAARFSKFKLIIHGAKGTFYMQDATTLRSFTTAGVVTTLCKADGSLAATDGQGLAANIPNVFALGCDETGLLYVLSTTSTNGTTSYRVSSIDANKQVTTQASLLLNQALQQIGVQTISAFLPSKDGSITLNTDKGLWKIQADGSQSCLVSIAKSPLAQTQRGPIPSIFYAFSLDGRLQTGELIVRDTNAISYRLKADGTLKLIIGQGHTPDTGFTTTGSLGAGFYNSLQAGGPSFDTDDDSGNLYFRLIQFVYSAIAKATPTTASSVASLIAPSQTATAYLTTGNSYTLQTLVYSDTTCQFQWYHNSVLAPGYTSQNLQFDSVDSSLAGKWSLKITNDAGSLRYDMLNVTVYGKTLSQISTTNHRTGGSFLWGIASNGSLIVCVGTNGKILSSDDGASWVSRSSGTTNWLVDVCYAKDRFLAVGDQGVILSSSDGITWTQLSQVPTTNRINKILYFRSPSTGTDYYCGVGEGGTLLYSNDGVSWNLLHVPADSNSQLSQTSYTGWLRGLCLLNADTATVACCGQGGYVAVIRLSDLKSAFIHPASSSASADLEALVAETANTSTGDFSFYAVGDKGVLTAYAGGSQQTIGGVTRLGLYLTQGDSSTIQPVCHYRAISKGFGAFLTAGENGYLSISASSLGPWNTLSTTTTANLVNTCFTMKRFFAVGADETILRSDVISQNSLSNISSRALAGTGDATLVCGFVVTGDHAKNYLIRAAGPTLATLGVSNVLTAPRLQLYQQSSLYQTAGAWYDQSNYTGIAQMASQLGAFAFSTTKADSAMLVSLSPGVYTAMVDTGTQGSGNVLLEAYDTSPSADKITRPINLSTRAQVSPDNYLISGFVVDGQSSIKLLLRGIGPGLKTLGVSSALTKAPTVELYQYITNTSDPQYGTWQLVTGFSNWASQPNANEIRTAAMSVGAFALSESGVLDAAYLLTVPYNGIYTLHLVPDGETGVGMLEIYEVP